MKGVCKLRKRRRLVMKKKNLLKMMFLMFITVFGVLSCDFLENKTVRVPKSVIESKAREKFPIVKNFAC